MWRPRILVQIAVVAAVVLLAGYFVHKFMTDDGISINNTRDTVKFFAESWPKETIPEELIKEEFDNGERNSTNKSVVDNSGTYELKTQGMNIEQRSKFQQAQTDKFCQQYNLTDRHLDAPHYGSIDTHLLVNREAKVLYCYAPKVGCTNLKIAFFMSQGKLKEGLVDVAPHTLVPDKHIAHTVHTNDYQSVKGVDRETYLKEFFKFVMYRHPLERLASAYRDKVKRWEPQYLNFRKSIFKAAHPNEYNNYYTTAKNEPDIVYDDFVSYWISTKTYDEHFIPIFELCQPCRVRYSYYGQFKTFGRHAAVLLDKINAKSKFLLEDYYKDQDKRTKFITRDLYDTVSTKNKRMVLKKLSQDIDFYYHVYPDEIGSHKEILQMSDDITVPY